jgi:hypothetical protein
MTSQKKSRKPNKFALWVIIVVLAAVIGLVSIQYFGNDNIVEELSEHVIKGMTGQRVDLSP